MTRCPGGQIGRRLVLSILSLLLVFVVVARPAFAQDLAGRVLDPHDRPVAGATVIVTRQSVVVAHVVSRADGGYGPIAVAAGEYDLVVSASGFRAAPTRVTLSAGAGVRTDVRLELAAVTDSVVVSAAQVEVPLSRTTSSVTVIDRATLDARQTETVADALGIVPGFGVVRSGGRGAIASVFPRGGDSDYTLFLADGVALNAFGGGFDAAHLGTADLDRIEVVRGAESALYGGGAIGGIVQLVTRRGGPPTAHAGLEGGGYGTWRAQASTAGSFDRWTWGGSIDRITSDGDTRELPRLGTRVSNDDYRRVAGTASLGWADTSGRRLRVDLRRSHDERGFPGPYGSDPDGLYDGINTVARGDDTTTSVGVSGAVGSASGLRHTGLVTWSRTPHQFTSRFGTSEDETRRVTARYQVDVSRLPAGVSAGVEVLREQADNTFITGEVFQPVPVRRLVAGWFAESRWSLGRRGALNAGVRLERIARRALEGNPSPFGARPAFDENVVWSANPKIAAAWFLRPTTAGGWTRIRMGAGTGIKPPNAFEIAFTDNPGLEPERSRSIDAGIEHAFARAAAVVDATWFANRYDDLIVAVGSSLSGASRYRTDNISNARATGLETGLAWRSPWGLHARAAWTWMDTEILGVDRLPSKAPTPFIVGEDLVRRPRHHASLELQWTSARGSAFLDLNGRGSMRDIEPNFASTIYDNPGYATVNVGGSVRLRRGVHVTLRVSNLFDREYEEAFGFPALGRSAIVGIRVAAGR